MEAIILVFIVYKDNGVFAAKLTELKDLNLDFFEKILLIILPVLLNDVLWAMASLFIQLFMVVWVLSYSCCSNMQYCE